MFSGIIPLDLTQGERRSMTSAGTQGNIFPVAASAFHLPLSSILYIFVGNRIERDFLLLCFCRLISTWIYLLWPPSSASPEPCSAIETLQVNYSQTVQFPTTALANMATVDKFDITACRDQFPALAQQQVFMDNAGGSQVLASVIESISTYYSKNNVQLGATYPVSQTSTAKYDDGVLAGAKYINAAPHEVVFGPATTQLFRNASIALTWPADSELVLSKCDHEANIAPWVQMAEWRGFKVNWWVPDNSKTNPRLEATQLKGLLTETTRLVACTHTSNILGTITDVRAIADMVHQTSPNALLAVDAVAYAPHGPIDVKALGVDIYSFSWYKVYGPHIAMLYASERAQREMQSLGHYFKSGKTLEEKLGLAGANYECVQAVPRVTAYLGAAGAWDAIRRREEEIQEVLLAYLRDARERGKVVLYGEESADREKRVPVISFLVKGRKSFEVIDQVEKNSRFGCRPGHFYSKRLVQEVLGLEDPDDGIVRVSLLHYNTVEEVKGLVEVFREVIG